MNIQDGIESGKSVVPNLLFLATFWIQPWHDISGRRKNARDLHLSPQDQHLAIVMVWFIVNMVYQCQLRLRLTPIPNTSG
jgi:hypothetical protein